MFTLVLLADPTESTDPTERYSVGRIRARPNLLWIGRGGGVNLLQEANGPN